MKLIPKFTAAAVQAAPVYLDSAGSTDRACALIDEAARNGARLVAFPEVFIPGYPYWNWMMSPLEGSSWFRRLYEASISLQGEEIARVRRAAAAARATVVIGINERSRVSMGTIYNTNVIIGSDGSLLGCHRKLVPTFAEKLTWGSGDGSTLKTYETAAGRIGTLACGENTNTLARFALLSQGEQVHIANYIAFPFNQNYDMLEAIRIRAGAHSFEGKVFTVVACSTMSPEIVAMLGTDAERKRLLTGQPNAFSGIFGPDGRLVCDPAVDEEGIVYGEIDVRRSIEPKQFQDIVGHYNRFDVFRLHLDDRPQHPMHLQTALGNSAELPAAGAPDR